MLRVRPPSEGHFALFRIALGAYLLFHFASLLTHAGRIFGSEGMLPDAQALPGVRYFPNLLSAMPADCRK